MILLFWCLECSRRYFPRMSCCTLPRPLDTPCLQLMILLVLSWEFRLLPGDSIPSSGTSPLKFSLVKYGVRKSQNTFQRAYWTFPLVLTGGIAINVFTFCSKPQTISNPSKRALNFTSSYLSLLVPVVLLVWSGCLLLDRLRTRLVLDDIVENFVITFEYTQREAGPFHHPSGATITALCDICCLFTQQSIIR